MCRICSVLREVYVVVSQRLNQFGRIPGTCGSGSCQDRVALERSFWKVTVSVWVAVKELKLSYYIGETLLFTIYTHYGNFLNSNPVVHQPPVESVMIPQTLL